MRIFRWLSRWWDRNGPKRKLILVDGDSPPEIIRSRNLYLAKDDGEDWSVAMRCPCGCGDRLELMLATEARPHWSVRSKPNAPPTLQPSVWRKAGCKSHFWVRDGRIVWC
ncbi:MAG TPA: hypothetical protein DD390_11275 [Rhodospirillaceae bacterium]|nr:hypothetical protein [Rhodospirillaceae bacterium]MAX62832.1 hypothetical protein [Rhodospirillaceae bacterium]MBB57677.1 hypothetical protein [Rhodospirillaceae bacterium]HBM13265.1 hypothetical protein [Rhodospirillaceae bacterium]